jgi:hypothetical protein
MKLKFLSIFLLTSCCFFGFGQVTFQKVYERKNENCNSIQPTFDGGYIMAATKWNTGGQYDMSLIKIDSTGELMWTKIYGSILFTQGSFAEQTNDGGYIVAGLSQPGMAGAYLIYIVKTDSAGILQWSKTYGGTWWSSYEAYKIKQTFDGGYIICGSASPNLLGPPAALLIKINAVGDTTWTKAYHGLRGANANSVEQTFDGGYVFTGDITDSLSTFVTNALIVKTDSNGDTLWTKCIGGSFNNCYVSANAIKQTFDSAYIMTGKTSSFGAGNDDVFLTKTDTGGNPVWTKTFGGIQADRGISLAQTQDSGYVVAGYTFSFGNSNGEYYLIKTNSNGDTLWTKQYGTSSYDLASDVMQTSDAGYIVSGSSGGVGSFGMYIIKTDSLGNSGCNENSTPTIVTSPVLQLANLQINHFRGITISIPPTFSTSAGSDSTICSTVGIPEYNNFDYAVNIYPNPFSQQTTLIFENSLQNATLSIMNCFGQLVKELVNISGHSFCIQRDNLPSGIYFVRLTINNEIISTNKLIIVND